jgi:hypothetical protein
MSRRLAACLGVSFITSALLTGPVKADPISVSDVFNFLDNRSPNLVGIGVGVRDYFGATSVTPNGNQGTAGTATQGSTTLALPFSGSPASPNFFGAATSSQRHIVTR